MSRSNLYVVPSVEELIEFPIYGPDYDDTVAPNDEFFEQYTAAADSHHQAGLDNVLRISLEQFPNKVFAADVALAVAISSNSAEYAEYAVHLAPEDERVRAMAGFVATKIYLSKVNRPRNHLSVVQ